MKPSDSLPAQLKIKTAAVVIAIFMAGAFTGIGTYRWMERPERPPTPVHFILAHLQLTAEQEVKAEEVIERHRPEIEAVFSEGFPKIEAINRKIADEVREFLRPEQREQLDRLLVEPPPMPGFGRGRGRRHFGPRMGGPGKGRPDHHHPADDRHRMMHEEPAVDDEGERSDGDVPPHRPAPSPAANHGAAPAPEKVD
jgi:hypothetical protein